MPENEQSFSSEQIERLVQEAGLLLARLERLSADSVWAHRASGLRGSLLRCLAEQNVLDIVAFGQRLKDLVVQGREILTKAAQEIPDYDQLSRKD